MEVPGGQVYCINKPIRCNSFNFFKKEFRLDTCSFCIHNFNKENRHQYGFSFSAIAVFAKLTVPSICLTSSFTSNYLENTLKIFPS